uniref:TIL domain-containing protein n=1 Tax=Anopheles atroparvus TaxID=41427 RepID=A0AAG5CRY7_ANOAO
MHFVSFLAILVPLLFADVGDTTIVLLKTTTGAPRTKSTTTRRSTTRPATSVPPTPVPTATTISDGALDPCLVGVVCPANSTYNCCGNCPEPTCDRPVIRGVCVTLCLPRCECNAGFIRQVAGACPLNEYFQCCGSCTEPTCAQPISKEICLDVCVAGCFCKLNYVRRVAGGPCVLPSRCPKPKPTETPSTTASFV